MNTDPQPGIVENGVLIGRDGYLFRAGDGQAVSDVVTGGCQVAPENFEIFRRNLSSRMLWAVAHNTRYLHLIMPDKQSIIPDSWPLEGPVRLGAVYTDRLPDLRPLFLYPVEFLARCGRNVVTRTGTHLSAYGSLLIAAFLAEGFTGESQSGLLAEIAGKLKADTGLPSDLGQKLNPPVRESTKTLSEPAPGVWCSNHILSGNNGGVDLRFNPRAPYPKRVAFFGDCFGRDVAAMLQFWFSEVYFFHTGYFHPEIAEQCGADIVITEHAERHLVACPDDEHRPNFMLFPYLGEKPCMPDKEFAEALSAVLSYPRMPYVNYVTGLGLIVRLPHDAAAQPAPKAPVQAYENLLLTERAPEEFGALQILEVPCEVARLRPVMIEDLSARELVLKIEPVQRLHGSYLVQRHDVLLFGPSNLVTRERQWYCEARYHRMQFLQLYRQDFYDVIYPGPKPVLGVEADGLRLDLSGLNEGDVSIIAEPVFLATPLEPKIWGRWVATVVPKAAHYRQHGAGRKFLCDVQHDWQRAFLQLLGIAEQDILPHDPGRTYICRDLMTVEYSEADLSVSPAERVNFFGLAARCRAPAASPRKLFVSRLSRSQANPYYRVLQNEAALIRALEALGFTAVEPELLPVTGQIGLFAAAEQIVFLGGSGIFNAAFCAPDSSVITIESSATYAGSHVAFFASLGLRHGVIFGQEDETDHSTHHKRWTLDIARALPLIESFFRDA